MKAMWAKAMSAGAAAVIISPGAAGAQVPEEAMEMQRCIWRCLAEFGTDDPAYGQCVANQCNEWDGAPAASVAPSPAPAPAPRQNPPPPGPGVLQGEWAFAAHPALGPVAHIATPAGTVAIGCGGAKAVLGLRFSNSLSPSANPTLMVEPGLYASTYPRLQGPWSGRDSFACDLPVQGLASGSALYVLPAQIAAIRSVGPETQITLTDGARQAVITTGPQALTAFGGYVVPLNGAYEALSALLATCPRAAQELAEGCGD